MKKFRISTGSQKCMVKMGRKTSLAHPKLFESLPVGCKEGAEHKVVNHMIWYPLTDWISNLPAKFLGVASVVFKLVSEFLFVVPIKDTTAHLFGGEYSFQKSCVIFYIVFLPTFPSPPLPIL